MKDVSESVKVVASTSTFLVPVRYMDFLAGKIESCGNLRFYLEELLKKYRPILRTGEIHLEMGGLHMLKQEGDQSLVRFNFRPFEEDWCEMKSLAMGYHVSMCFIFSFLLSIETGERSLEENNIIQCEPYLPFENVGGVGYPTQTYSLFEVRLRFLRQFGTEDSEIVRKTRILRI